VNAIRKHRADILPRSLPPVGICREESAAFIGVSATLFDAMVDDGRMPKPKKINGRVVWSVRALTMAFEALPDGTQGNSWDKICSSGSGTGQDQ
jgi:hypothetical protein